MSIVITFDVNLFPHVIRHISRVASFKFFNFGLQMYQFHIPSSFYVFLKYVLNVTNLH